MRLVKYYNHTESAIGCERVIPRSDVKLLDSHVWLQMSSVNPDCVRVEVGLR